MWLEDEDLIQMLRDSDDREEVDSVLEARVKEIEL